MKRAFAYLGVFFGGVVVGYVVDGFTSPSMLPQSSRRSFGMTDSYVLERFAPVCEGLQAKGCSCEPVVFTENTCESDLRDLLDEQLFAPEGRN